MRAAQKMMEIAAKGSLRPAEATVVTTVAKVTAGIGLGCVATGMGAFLAVKTPVMAALAAGGRSNGFVRPQQPQR
jgi:hypothetical protein